MSTDTLLKVGLTFAVIGFLGALVALIARIVLFVEWLP